MKFLGCLIKKNTVIFDLLVRPRIIKYRYHENNVDECYP